MSATLVTDYLFEAKPRWSGTIGSGGVAASNTTTIPLASAANLDNGDAYVFVVNRVNSAGVKNELSAMETVIGELSGTNFINCVRGQEGTAQAWDAGTVVEILFTATHWNKLITAWEVAHNQDGTHKSGLALPSPVITTPQINDTSSDHQYILGVSELAADRTVTLPLLTASDEFVFQAHGLTTSANSNFTYHGLARQAIINGNFDVWQRGTSFTASANNDDVYTADRWNLFSDGNDVLDVSQEAVTDLPGSNYAIKLDVETAKRAGIVQFLEAKDAQKFKGKSVSISFAVKSANISAIRATVLSWASTADAVTSDVVGTWAATPTWATNWADNATPADLTVTSSWTTVKVENIAIDESTVNNLALAIWLPNEETIGDIVYISQVQMNVGSVALPFQPKSYEDEETACERYCQAFVADQTNGTIGAIGIAFNTAGAQLVLPLRRRMRTVPTLTATASDWKIGDSASSTDVTAMVLATAINSSSSVVLEVSASSVTQFRPYFIIGDGTANRTLILNAEL